MVKKGGIKKKKGMIIYKVVSEAGTGYFYLVKRNPRKKPDKITLRKYDPVKREHVIFKEHKLSS